MSKRTEINMASSDSLTIVVNVPKIIRRSFKVALSKADAEAGNVAECVLELDMSAATADALLDNAIRTVVINTQGKIRTQCKKNNVPVSKIDGQVYHAAIKPSERVSMPPMERARMLLRGFSREQCEALFAELGREALAKELSA
jgi:predicted RNase H-like nuclease (RuvC/YqgF family)